MHFIIGCCFDIFSALTKKMYRIGILKLGYLILTIDSTSAYDLFFNSNELNETRFYPGGLVVWNPLQTLIKFAGGIVTVVSDKAALVGEGVGGDWPREVAEIERLKREMEVSLRVPPFDGLKKCDLYGYCEHNYGFGKIDCKRQQERLGYCPTKDEQDEILERKRRYVLPYACSSVISRPFYELRGGTCSFDTDEIKETLKTAADSLKHGQAALREIHGQITLLGKQEERITAEIVELKSIVGNMTLKGDYENLQWRRWLVNREIQELRRRTLDAFFMRSRIILQASRYGPITIRDLASDLALQLIDKIDFYNDVGAPETAELLMKAAPIVMQPSAQLQIIEKDGLNFIEATLFAKIPFIRQQCTLFAIEPVVLRHSDKCLTAPKSYFEQIFGIDCGDGNPKLLPSSCLMRCDRAGDKLIICPMEFCPIIATPEWPLHVQEENTTLYLDIASLNKVEMEMCEKAAIFQHIGQSMYLLTRPATVAKYKHQTLISKKKYGSAGFVFKLGCGERLKSENQTEVKATVSCNERNNTLFLKLDQSGTVALLELYKNEPNNEQADAINRLIEKLQSTSWLEAIEQNRKLLGNSTDRAGNEIQLMAEKAKEFSQKAEKLAENRDEYTGIFSTTYRNSVDALAIIAFSGVCFIFLKGSLISKLLLKIITKPHQNDRGNQLNSKRQIFTEMAIYQPRPKLQRTRRDYRNVENVAKILTKSEEKILNETLLPGDNISEIAGKILNRKRSDGLDHEGQP